MMPWLCVELVGRCPSLGRLPAATLASLALLFLAAPASPAQEWTRFRGSNGAGLSATSFPAQISEADIAWKAPLPGVGHSSPVAWGNRVFVFSADPETATRYVVCLNLATGESQWRREFPSQPHHLHPRSSYASCTPAVDAQHLYVAWSTPEETTLLALDHDGHDVWRRNLGRWVSQHGFGASPIVYKDTVILHDSQQGEELKEGEQPGQTQVLAVNRNTGETVWTTPLGTVRVNYSVPCLLTSSDGKATLVCCSTSEGVFGMDPDSGKLLWSTPEAFSMRTVASPIIAGGLIFGSTGSGGGGNYVVAVKPGERPEIVYSVKRQAPYVPTMVAKGDLVFLWDDKGVVTCLDAATGQQHWRERVDGAYSGSPIIAGDIVYCMSEEGELIALAASKEFRQLGRTPLGAPSRATPSVAGGMLLLRTYTHLIAVRSKTASN